MIVNVTEIGIVANETVIGNGVEGNGIVTANVNIDGNARGIENGKRPSASPNRWKWNGLGARSPIESVAKRKRISDRPSPSATRIGETNM